MLHPASINAITRARVCKRTLVARGELWACITQSSGLRDKGFVELHLRNLGKLLMFSRPSFLDFAHSLTLS